MIRGRNCTRLAGVIAATAALCAACATPASKPEPKADPKTEATPMALEIKSSAFSQGQPIPARYTCDGDDVSPALTWSAGPQPTVSYAIICDDPDAPAGTWTHWVIYAIPAGTTSLPEAVPKSDSLPGGALQGKSSFNRIGYGGPCPPPGKPHRYFFKLYALDVDIKSEPGVTSSQLNAKMKGHILAQGELMGTYKRK
jgi:Raf kinase inhibitor-like YbhB/YbcL family protein